uniref:HTH CENPB-type domain-containing protein n=1 Tax=Globisporangium ultimum (strain ATCC 200006 / CBS 805.95 / DAOM BR144) TaxID=431595 RepID=K3WU94_GLOUD
MRSGRPRVRGNGRRPRKPVDDAPSADTAVDETGVIQRTSVDYRHKLTVIEYFLAHGRDASATVEHFYPDATKDMRRTKMKLLSAWLKQHDKIRERCESGLAHQRNVRHQGQGATLSREMEAQIVEWMHAQHRTGVKVTAKMLQQKARAVAAECGLGEDVFTASWSWRDGFLRRHFRSPHAAPAKHIPHSEQRETTPQKSSDSGAEQDVEREPDIDMEDDEDTEEEGSTAGEEKATEKSGEDQDIAQETVAPKEDLASVLHQHGLSQYLEVLQENGFETPASLAGIDEYFKDLGVKLGHRKLFKDVSIRYTPGMEARVPFAKVVIDIQAHFEWNKKCKFMAKSICQQWPKNVSVEVQNLFYGRIHASADSSIGYSYKETELSAGEPRRCKGEIVFSATLRDLYEAGYDTKDWKPFHHRLTLDKSDQ